MSNQIAKFGLLCLIVLAVSVPAYGQLIGPVPSDSVPGGVDVTDNEFPPPDEGERWGRGAGKDVTYEVLDRSRN